MGTSAILTLSPFSPAARRAEERVRLKIPREREREGGREGERERESLLA